MGMCVWISTLVASHSAAKLLTPAEKRGRLAVLEADGSLSFQSVRTVPSAGAIAGVGKWVRRKPNEPSSHSMPSKACVFHF